MPIRNLILFALFALLAVPCGATTYYLANASTSPAGNDANNGTSAATPWLSPNHALNCGDVIIAAASTAYSNANFQPSKWGTVTCAGGNNVAWLECATAFACQVNTTTGTNYSIVPGASYWGLQGWVAQNSSTSGPPEGCITVSPASTNISHVIIANNIAENCNGGGLGCCANGGTASADYVAFIGNISYNNAAVNTGCNSGISINAPAASDTLPGTHILVAGNFIWDTGNPAGCFDGEGINLDTWDSYGGGPPNSYNQQGVVENNISISNSGPGIEIEYNNAGNGPSYANIFIKNNTTWNNNINPNQYGNTPCGEIQLRQTVKSYVTQNITSTNTTGCFTDTGNGWYAYYVSHVDGTSFVYNNFGYAANSDYTGSDNATGFGFGPNNTFSNSTTGFVNPATPSAPSCGGYTTTTSCMATVIANFTPTTAAAKAYGYQIPSTTSVYDPLYPQWLCTVTNLPTGLVTPGCVTGSAMNGATFSGGQIH